MSVKSIKISNLLSYNSLLINEIKDLNCIIGKNNSGKSNLLKLLRFFYQKIEGRKVLPPSLNSNYSSFGSITIEYDLSRIKSIVTSSRSKKTDFTKHIYNTFFNEDRHKDLIFPGQKEFFSDSIKLTLFVNKDESIKWSTSDYKK